MRDDVFPGLRQKPADVPAAASAPVPTLQTEPPRLAAPRIQGLRPRSFLLGFLANSLIACLLTILSVRHAPESKVVQVIVTPVASPVQRPEPPRPKPAKAAESKPAAEGAARKASVKRPFVPPSPKPRAAEVVEPPPAAPVLAVGSPRGPVVWAPVPPPINRPVVDLGPDQNGADIRSRPGTRPDGDPLGPGENGETGTGQGVCARGPCGASPGITRILDPDELKTAVPGGAPPKRAFTPPEILFLPHPAYPASALREKMQGKVVVSVTFLAKERRVVFRQFVRGLNNADLEALAQKTVEAIRFLPAKLDGEEVDCDGQVTFDFRVAQLTNLTTSF